MAEEQAMACRVLSRRAMKRGSFLRATIARERGFSLVELGAVVVIVGILAVIALVGYRKYILSSKLSEAQNVIGAIRLAQEDFKAERGTYFGAAFGGNTWCPTDGVTQAGKKVQWASPCWASLPVHVEAPVQFGYFTNGGIMPTDAWQNPAPIAGATTMTFIAPAPGDRPWYTVAAKADLGVNGAPYTILATASNTNQVFIENEGD
jgi:type IV pilus assembly protein PilA